MQMQSFQLQIANFWKIANKIADNPIVHSLKLNKKCKPNNNRDILSNSNRIEFFTDYNVNLMSRP